jgi:SNF2 family DNA or RNA helicase
MSILKSTHPISWSHDDQGVAIFFVKKKDYEKALRGAAKGAAGEAFERFELLLESGEANVRDAREGLHIAAEDAVRLDQATRDCFGLPPQWPGSLLLDTHSVPNLRDFDAKLRLIDVMGYAIDSWSLRGGILRIGDDCYLPGPEVFACLTGFEKWKALAKKTEADHLRLIHVLSEAFQRGCRVNIASVGKIKVATPSEIVVEASGQSDGSILLTPVPMISDLVDSADSESILRAYIQKVEERLMQLEGSSEESILRIGSTLVLLDKEQTIQARSITSSRRVPVSQAENFRRNPAKWLADHHFVHGQVEFLPRVIGIGEWSGGYLGAAGVLGEKIDWFDKKPTAEPVKKNDADVSSDRKSDPESNEDNEIHQRPLVPIIEKNDGELGWGLRHDRATHPDTVCISTQLDRYPRRPYPHQQEAIEWLARHAERCGKPARWEDGQKFWGAGALLADDMGLGKTLSTLLFLSEWHKAWLSKVGETPPACLIVCPLSLVDNWRQEIELAFTNDLNPFSRVIRAIPDAELGKFLSTPNGKDRIKLGSIAPEQAIESYGLRFGDGTEQSLDQPGSIVITTYTTLRDYRFSFAGCNWNAVIFDEAQNIKNPNALQTVAAKALKGFFRIALSGTPVENHLTDLWSLMDAVEPGALGSFKEFRTEYIHPLSKDPSQLGAIGENLRKHLDPLILRRTKESSLEGLPKKNLVPVQLKMTAEQAVLYDEVLHLANQVDDECPKQQANRSLASMWELRRVSLHPALLGNASVEGLTNARHSRDYLCRSAKLAWLLEQLDRIRAKGEKALIFSIQKKLQDMLSSHLSEIYGVKVPVINGDTKAISSRKPNETRLGLIHSFSNSTGFAICVLSPIAAGAGLNITAANHVIHIERHWNPAKEDQATDRAYRIGQTKDVYVYIPLLDHPSREITTFDTGLNRLISQKKQLAGSLGLVPIQPVNFDELVESVIKGTENSGKTSSPLYLDVKSACELSWELFEALIAEIYGRESDRVILTLLSRDYGADVIVIGHNGNENVLIQVKTTKHTQLNSEEAIRQVEGSLPHYESTMGLKFTKKFIHTNVRSFSKGTKKAGITYKVQLFGEEWLKKALERHSIRLAEVVDRNARREPARIKSYENL